VAITIVQPCLRQRLPSISCWAEFARAGNLMSYGPGHRDYFRRTATYVDRLLRGAKPGDLPIEQPTRFELVINRITARSIGVTLQNSLLARADEMIG
jgi:putative ABC transport system substrate-binding protein